MKQLFAIIFFIGVSNAIANPMCVSFCEECIGKESTPTCLKVDSTCGNCKAILDSVQIEKERIAKDGLVKEGNVLKVDSFLNHQMDIALLKQIGQEFHRRFAHKKITKVLTIESSGIAIAYPVAEAFGVPLVFALQLIAGIIVVTL
mgnify:CR=1 FL=1